MGGLLVRNEKGIALLAATGILSLLLMTAVSFVFNARLDERAARNYCDYVTAEFTLRAGVEHAFSVLLASRGEGQDSFASPWSVEFAGEDYDNSGDGERDSIWLPVRDSSGSAAGWYAVLVEDESARLNLNLSGNLTSGISQGQNEGWSPFEVSVADVLSLLGFAYPDEDAYFLITRRYGGFRDPGGESLSAAVLEGGCGADLDGSGRCGGADPRRFTPWKPRADLGHSPYIEFTQAATLGGGWESRWEAAKDVFSVYSRTANEYAEGGIRKRKVNVNAFDSPCAFHGAVSGSGLPGGVISQYAVNILDYRDDNHWITEFSEPGTGRVYYGVESVMINEVLSRSFKVDKSRNLNNSGEIMGFTYSGLAPQTNYRVSIRLLRMQGPANIMVKVGGGAWEAYKDRGLGSHDYKDIVWARSDSEGKIKIYTQFIKTKEHPLIDDSVVTGSVQTNRVEFTAAEFIELVNIGSEEVEIGGWSVKISQNDSETIPRGVVAPGDYFVLTNDLELFSASYPEAVGKTVEISGWESGYRTAGALADSGVSDIRIYVDEERGLLADLAVCSANTPNVSRPGDSGSIGVSREKNDPAMRQVWINSPSGRASPGADNCALQASGREILAGLRSGEHPPLVKNKRLANLGELTRAFDWRAGRTGELKYAGVRAGLEPWLSISAEDLGLMAEMISAGHYLRLDESTAEASGALYIWDARLDRNFCRGSYLMYAYGEFSGQDDIRVRVGDEDFGVFSYQSCGGVLIGEISCGLIGEDGSLPVMIDGEFHYIILVPDSVQGRINVNTAFFEVLAGLPGVDAALAWDIARETGETALAGIGELLTRGIVGPEVFAPISNLISVSSGTFRIICTARTPRPEAPEDPGSYTAEKRAEVVADLSSGSLRILSWKELKN